MPPLEHQARTGHRAADRLLWLREQAGLT